MSFARRFLARPSRKIKLDDWKTDETAGLTKARATKLLKQNVDRLAELQYLLYAENKHALLVVFQAMDAGGKDGTIRNVFKGVDPHGIKVTSFKAPTPEELEYDFLWHIHKAIPHRGEIGVFNRSHYEDVLVARVRDLVPKKVWSKRYDQINRFEQTLAENRIVILKFFLHISKAEQQQRLEARLRNPKKNWKFNPADFEERKHWDDYVKAYEAVPSRCSAKWAPWFIVPADRKWFRNVVVSQIIADTLEGLRMKFPKANFEPSKVVLKD